MHGLCEGIPTTRGSKHANRLLACVFVQAQDHADALEMLLETLLLLCSHQLHGKEFRLVRNKDKKENKKRTFILDVTPKTIISKSILKESCRILVRRVLTENTNIEYIILYHKVAARQRT